ncbi:hypothetical protein ACE10Z_18910 [Bradyrhizobium sp. Pha-3]|uniref:hypothetical protein n=1 Tax=Bradyrhizobium sp. Pha-3 TaxID=208375 RepID=UPI0035D509CD
MGGDVLRLKLWLALLKRTRTTYQGPLVIGHDLMSFVISDKVGAFAPDGTAMK